MAQTHKPRFCQSKKKVQGERKFLRGLLANVYAKISGHRKGQKRLRKHHREDDMGLGTWRMIQGKKKEGEHSRERSPPGVPVILGDPPGSQVWLQEETWLGWEPGRETEVIL